MQLCAYPHGQWWYYPTPVCGTEVAVELLVVKLSMLPSINNVVSQSYDNAEDTGPILTSLCKMRGHLKA